MDNSLFLIIVNAVIYWITFLIYQIKRKCFDLGSLLLLVFAISFSTSIYYFIYTSIDFTEYHILPAVFLYICILICIHPILKYHEIKHLRKFKIEKNTPIIEIFTLILAIFSVIPCIENFILCLNSSVDSSSISLGSIYANEINLDEGLSWLGRKLNWLINTFQFVIPVLLFFELSKNRIRKYVVFGLILAILSILFNSYANASRVGIARVLFYLIICYYLCRPYIPLKRNTRIKNIGILSLSFGIILLFLVTLSRFNYDTVGKENEEDNALLTWISLYTGEGSLRFNMQMWSVTSHSNGDNSFSLIKNCFGLKTFKSNDERRSFYAAKMDIETDVFYTFIGDFYSDLGILGTFILSILLSLILKIALNHLINSNIESIIIAAVLLNIYIFGFTYYPYKTYNSQIVLSANLLFCFFVYINRILSKQ